MEYLRHKAQAAHSAMLTNADRWAIMRSLHHAYLVRQRSKIPEQVAEEERAEWIAKRPRFNPRYLALMAEAKADAP